jgi:heptaprenyl diphosphate synthase
VATGAALLALACILGLVEAALPSVPLAPWLHLGLANVAVVVALALSGAGVAAVVSLGRVLIVGLATGSLASPPFAMAATGALASLAVMWALAVGVPSLSVVGWSAAGSAAHVLGQFFVAAALLGSDSLLVLAPPSVLLALLLGAVVGTLARTAVSLIASG